MLDAAAPLGSLPHPSPGPKPNLGYAPTTFLERGVWVPFTTPLLAGARMRPAPRGGLELIVPNPAGTRGVYILPWEGIFALCTPTVHDRVLNTRIEAMRGVTPTGIRRAAHALALEGLAGRAAARAAEAAGAAEADLVTVTSFELLLRLIGPDAAADAGPQTSTEDLEQRAQRAVAACGVQLGRSADEVAGLLEGMARLYAGIGTGASARMARVGRLRAALATLRQEVAAALRTPPALTSPDADLILAGVDLTLACLRTTVDEVISWLADMPGLLRRWVLSPDEVPLRLARPDWLLDGWERICLLWVEGGPDREARFASLADLVPATPREAASWVDAPVETVAGALRLRRRVGMNQDWRTGACVMDLIARNERLRALSPGGTL